MDLIMCSFYPWCCISFTSMALFLVHQRYIFPQFLILLGDNKIHLLHSSARSLGSRIAVSLHFVSQGIKHYIQWPLFQTHVTCRFFQSTLPPHLAREVRIKESNLIMMGVKLYRLLNLTKSRTYFRRLFWVHAFPFPHSELTSATLSILRACSPCFFLKWEKRAIPQQLQNVLQRLELRPGTGTAEAPYMRRTAGLPRKRKAAKHYDLIWTGKSVNKCQFDLRCLWWFFGQSKVIFRGRIQSPKCFFSTCMQSILLRTKTKLSIFLSLFWIAALYDKR